MSKLSELGSGLDVFEWVPLTVPIIPKGSCNGVRSRMSKGRYILGISR